MDRSDSWSRRRMTVPSKPKPNHRFVVVTPTKSETDEGFHETQAFSAGSDRQNELPTISFPKLYAAECQGTKSYSTPNLLSLQMDITESQLKSKYQGAMKGELQTFELKKIVKNDSFFSSMRPFLYIAQISACLLPVSGISGANHESLYFRWKSWRVVLCIICLASLVFLFVLTFRQFIHNDLSYDSSAPVMFYGSTIVANVLFLQLSISWPELNHKIAQTEQKLIDHGYPMGQRVKFLVIIVLFVVCALVEHILCLLVDAMRVSPCIEEHSLDNAMKAYFQSQYYQVFSVLEYNPMLALLMFFCNFVSTCWWNLTDLFLGLMGLALSSKLKQINDVMESVQGEEKPSAYWRKLREEYNAVSVLIKDVDNYIQRLMLLSIGNNLFFICLTLLKGLKKRINTYQIIYFFWSFGFLIIRTLFVTLCPAGIYDESRSAKTVLFSVPHNGFCHEVRRFLTQIISDDLALTGCKFFSVTRSLILTVMVEHNTTIAGTVVTYEIVLVQFKTDTGAEDWPTRENRSTCATIARI